MQNHTTRTLRILAAIVFCVLVYAVAGFVVAPKIIRSVLLKDIPAYLDATATVGEIHVNPFLLQVTATDFALAGPGGGRLLGFRRLFIDFEASSLWHRAYSFANIDLAAPYVNATLGPDGLNLARLQSKKSAAKPARVDTPELLPRLRIGSFKVSDGALAYEDHSQADVFTARLQPIAFELRNFTTGAEGGRFTFTAASKLGERIEWHGHLSVQPLASDGEFRVDGLRARTLWDYLEDRVNFVVNSGTIDLGATYQFSSPPGGRSDFKLAVSRLAVTDLTVRPRDADSDWVTVPRLAVTGTTVDVLRQRAQVDRVSITGLTVAAWLEPDGSLNLLKLAGASAAGATGVATAGVATAKVATAIVATAGVAMVGVKTAAPAWQYAVRHFDVHEAAISVEDRTVNPAVRTTFAPVAVEVEGVSQDLTRPLKVTLDTQIDGQGSLSLTGDATPQPAAASLNVKLSGLDLTPMQPYLAERTSMTLLGGELGVEGVLRYGPGVAQNAPAALGFTGNVSLQNLHTVDNALRDDFIDVERLDVMGLHYAQAPARLDIDQVVARKLYARVIIESDASLNVTRVLTGPVAAAGRAGRAGPAGSAGVAASPARALPLAIKNIQLHAGRLDFTDLSVMPNFTAGIQKLEGGVLGLSSKAGSRAKIDLQGAVDTFSPVTIAGEVDALSGKLYTDVAVTFRNIQLAVFNPYSGKFAGYDVTRGKLSTEFRYKVDGRKLDAQHHIVIDQLEFGDRTGSKDAVSLPVKLAVALLKDRNGIISLDLPVSGSLDDPEFRLAPLLWKVFVNVLEKAVTSPFALLGELFGGGPDLQFIDFRPGVATLDAAAVDKAKTVAKALLERPQLKLEIPIVLVPDVDRPALIAASVEARLNEAGPAKKSPGKAPAAAAPNFAQLDAGGKLDRLTQVYTEEQGFAPKFPDEVNAIKAKSDLAAAKVEFLTKALRDHAVVSDVELQALAQQRALNVQKALLDGTEIDPERVFVVVNDKGVRTDDGVRLELALQ